MSLLTPSPWSALKIGLPVAEANPLDGDTELRRTPTQTHRERKETPAKGMLTGFGGGFLVERNQQVL